MTYGPGECGNPNGRPPNPNTVLRALCKRDVYKFYDLLWELMENRAVQDSVRFQAIKFGLEAGFGRPTQSVKFEMDFGSAEPTRMTRAQLRMAASGRIEELRQSIIAEVRKPTDEGSHLRLIKQGEEQETVNTEVTEVATLVTPSADEESRKDE